MSGGNRIIAFDAANASAADDEILLTEESHEVAAPAPEWDAAEDEEPAALPSGGWLLPALGIALLLAWTAFYGWAMQGKFTAATTPGQWIELIRDWTVPVVLLAVIWLVAMRNSRREGVRFGNVARVLSDESALLETRLSTVNRELSLAREFIAAQSRDLETLGRLAADKLSTEADRLQGLIRDNHARVETIGTVSAAALDNMEKLRGQLPVIASSAKDVTNNIGNAGRTAHAQLQDMIIGFRKLNEFGQASERQVQILRNLVDETIGEFSNQAEQFANLSAERFAEFRERGAEFRNQLEHHEVEALAAVRTRASAMAEELEQTRTRLDADEAESLTSMRARLSALREEGTAISRALRDGETRALEGWQAGVARMKEELQSALVALQEAEAEAIEASQARIGSIGDDIARYEREALEQAGRFTQEIAQRHAETVAAEEAAAARMRDHFAALDEAAVARRERHGEIDQASAQEMRERLAAIDTEMAERRARHSEQGAEIAAQAEAIAAQLAEFETRATAIAAQGNAAKASLATSLDTLTERLAASRLALAGTEGEIAGLTDSSVRLLELIQASHKQSSEQLPQALLKSEDQLSAIEARMVALREAAKETDARGAHLADTIDTANGTLQRSYGELSALQAELEKAGALHGETLVGLRGQLDAIAAQSSELTEATRAQLTAALEDLTRSTRYAIETFGENGSNTVNALAQQLGSQSAAALDQAMRASAAQTAGQLEQAVTHAASISREAAMQLRDQLGKVNELAGNLESRVAHARERAEEQVDNDFTRRVALITESLNSNAIDIAKALSTDVADTAWTSYLRGDRGIFTRRAVNLVDNADAKAIVQIYERDRDFHEHVSRYIHDFEAMLRQVLSARDGQAMSVTLLSSDMGKLYVALAQAIQRLRS
ncbi:MAG TPA: ATPase [Novosphingobium sp.]